MAEEKRARKVGGNPKPPRAAGTCQDGADVRNAGRRTVTSEEVGQPEEAPELVLSFQARPPSVISGGCRLAKEE